MHCLSKSTGEKCFLGGESGIVVPLLRGAAPAPWRPSHTSAGMLHIESFRHFHDSGVWRVLTTTYEEKMYCRAQGCGSTSVARRRGAAFPVILTSEERKKWQGVWGDFGGAWGGGGGVR